MKPHLVRMDGRWHCMGHGVHAVHANRGSAFLRWIFAMHRRYVSRSVALD